MTATHRFEESVVHRREKHLSQTKSDADIIAESIRDPRTFGELFDRHWAVIYTFCSRRAGRDGEDIAAEVFRLAFDHRDRYDPGFPDARPWLFGIAGNSLRTHFRSTQRRERNGEWVLALLRRESACADELAGSEELAGLSLDPELAQALAGLTTIERDALLLLAWEGLEYAEIARALDIPLGTVRSRIHRARQHMRAALNERTSND